MTTAQALLLRVKTLSSPHNPMLDEEPLEATEQEPLEATEPHNPMLDEETLEATEPHNPMLDEEPLEATEPHNPILDEETPEATSESLHERPEPPDTIYFTPKGYVEIKLYTNEIKDLAAIIGPALKEVVPFLNSLLLK